MPGTAQGTERELVDGSCFVQPLHPYSVVGFGHGDPVTAGLFHAGHDIKATPGDEVFAVSDGIVRYTGTASGVGAVAIEHVAPDGTAFQMVYAQLSVSHVSEGTDVERGTAIGTANDLGHVHVHVYRKPNSSNLLSPAHVHQSEIIDYADPVDFMNEHGTTFCGGNSADCVMVPAPVEQQDALGGNASCHHMCTAANEGPECGSQVTPGCNCDLSIVPTRAAVWFNAKPLDAGARVRIRNVRLYGVGSNGTYTPIDDGNSIPIEGYAWASGWPWTEKEGDDLTETEPPCGPTDYAWDLDYLSASPILHPYCRHVPLEGFTQVVASAEVSTRSAKVQIGIDYYNGEVNVPPEICDGWPWDRGWEGSRGGWGRCESDNLDSFITITTAIGLPPTYMSHHTCVPPEDLIYHTTVTCPGGGNCSGNGVCDPNSGTCICNTPFQPPDCSLAACPGTPPCSGHGTCNSGTGACSCDPNWADSDCSTPCGGVTQACCAAGECNVGYSCNSSQLCAAPETHQVRVRWTGIPASSNVYLYGAMAYGDTNCVGWNSLGTPGSGTSLDTTFEVPNPGIVALWIQGYADEDTNPQNGANYWMSQTGTVQAWVDGVLMTTFTGPKCGSSGDNVWIPFVSSSVAAPTAPVLDMPAAGASIASGPTTFSVLPVTGAGRYHFMICHDVALTTGCLNPDGAMDGLEPSSGTTQATATLNPGFWYWSARAIAPGDESPWGPYATPRSLTVSTTPSSHHVRIRWTGVPSSPHLYLLGSEAYSTWNCAGWSQFGQFGSGTELDTTFLVATPGVTALWLQGYADVDTNPLNGATTYLTTTGGVQAWVDGTLVSTATTQACGSGASNLWIPFP